MDYEQLGDDAAIVVEKKDEKEIAYLLRDAGFSIPCVDKLMFVGDFRIKIWWVKDRDFASGQSSVVS